VRLCTSGASLPLATLINLLRLLFELCLCSSLPFAFTSFYFIPFRFIIFYSFSLFFILLPICPPRSVSVSVSVHLLLAIPPPIFTTHSLFFLHRLQLTLSGQFHAVFSAQSTQSSALCALCAPLLSRQRAGIARPAELEMERVLAKNSCEKGWQKLEFAPQNRAQNTLSLAYT